MRNIIGNKVKEARKLHRPELTQAQLAILLQMDGWIVDRFIISKIERGERQVTDLEVVAIAKALGINIGFLFSAE